MGGDPKSARDAALLLLRDVADRGAAAPSAETATRACERLLAEISRWIGTEACDALAARALAQAAVDHPLLHQVRLRQGGAVTLDGSGGAEVVEAIGGFLVAFIELLARFVGEPMAIQLAVRSCKGGGDR